jgi:hypothetical protein
MARWRKKPIEIEAVQLRWATWNEVCDFLGDIVSLANPARYISGEEASHTCGEPGPQYIALTIPTLEGDHTALHGDWIIKGVKGEFYPCKPDIFEATYEAVDMPEDPAARRLLDDVRSASD